MLKGKIALITGASRGIGKEIAITLAKNGADIALNYNSNQTLAKEVKALIQKENVKCEIYQCDVSDHIECKNMTEAVVKDFGRVDILVNNAGITKDGLIAMMPEDNFDKVIDTNLKGAFNMIKHLSSNFIRNRSGAIINISSIIGLMGNAGQANYAAAKAGLIGLTKSVAKEFASRGVTCNAIAPGFIESDMTNSLTDEVKQKYLSLVPMKKFGTGSDVAGLVVFLARTSYITGEVIKVDGGLYI